MKNKVMRIVKIVLNVIFYSFIICLLLFSIANIKVKKVNQLPSLFGRSYAAVQSSSMDGTHKDSFKKGDLVLLKNVEGKEEIQKNLKVGDIVTFYGDIYSFENGDPVLVAKGFITHRIVAVIQSEGGSVSYFCQGDYLVDNSNYDDFVITEDNYQTLVTEGKMGDSQNQTQYQIKKDVHYNLIGSGQVAGVMTGKIGGAGNTIQFISNPSVSEGGFLYVVVLPTFIFLGIEVFLFIKNFLNYKSEKLAQANAEQHQAETDAEKERMKEELRKELLAEMMKEQQEKENPSSEPKDDTKEE